MSIMLYVRYRRVVTETTAQDKSTKLSTAFANSVSLMQKRSTNGSGLALSCLVSIPPHFKCSLHYELSLGSGEIRLSE